MGKIDQGGQAPMNTLKNQPGQVNPYEQKFHPLPGEWAQQQMNGKQPSVLPSQKTGGTHTTEIHRALAAERAQHEYWEEWQGIKSGKAVYEDPREMQNTLLPSAKYGTEGRGYG